MQIDRFSFCKGLLPIAVCCAMTGCVDDKYDLSDIDTTTRVSVNNLTVPINLESIKLDDVVDLDDNENIKTLTDANGRPYYALQENGNFETPSFSIPGIQVNSLAIDPLSYTVNLPDEVVQAGSLIGGTIPVAINGTLPVPIGENQVSTYEFKMDNIDPALLKLKDIKTRQPISLSVNLSISNQFMQGGNAFSFTDVEIKLPTGLLGVNINTGNGEEATYNKNTGVVHINRLNIGADGKARLSLSANGLELSDDDVIVNHTLKVSDKIGLTKASIAYNIDYVSIPSQVAIAADFGISNFYINSFSGDIDYKMDDVAVDPISLSDLPDFLNNKDTEIRIADPTINVKVKNPVGDYGMSGRGKIHVISTFDNGKTTEAYSDWLTIEKNGVTDITLGTSKPAGVAEENFVYFGGLGDILTNEEAGGLPETITVRLENLNFLGDIKDFPLGQDFAKENGTYDFTAPLGFADGSIVVYETTENGWNSEDLDKIFINNIHLTANCTTDLPVGVHLEVMPLDKNGNEIKVKENSAKFEIGAKSDNTPVELNIESADGTPITNFDGIKFRAVINQNSGNTDAIGPDQYIELKNLRISVDGYYETDF